MGVERDRDMSLLRARVRDRVHDSHELVARATTRGRAHEQRADADLQHAERQFDRAASGLPGVYGLALHHRDGTARDALGHVLETARRVYHGCHSVGVTTVLHHGPTDRWCPVTAACTGVAGPLDAAQHALGEGPCVDAVELDQVGVVHAEDLADVDVAGSWPRFSEVARACSVGSALAIGIPWTGRGTADRPAVGAITLYAPEAHAFVEPEARGLVLATWAGSVLTGARPADVYGVPVLRARPGRLPRAVDPSRSAWSHR